MTTYPTYYSYATRCVKRESDTVAIEVQIPVGANQLPLKHERVTYPTKESLDEEIKNLSPADQDLYESYLAMLYQTAEKNRKLFNDYRQKKFDKNKARV